MSMSRLIPVLTSGTDSRGTRSLWQMMQEALPGPGFTGNSSAGATGLVQSVGEDFTLTLNSNVGLTVNGPSNALIDPSDAAGD